MGVVCVLGEAAGRSLPVWAFGVHRRRRGDAGSSSEGTGQLAGGGRAVHHDTGWGEGAEALTVHVAGAGAGGAVKTECSRLGAPEKGGPVRVMLGATCGGCWGAE